MSGRWTPNIEASQQLGAKGEEWCPGHRHSGGLVQDEHELQVEGRGPYRGSSWCFRNLRRDRTWSKDSEEGWGAPRGSVWRWWQQSAQGDTADGPPVHSLRQLRATGQRCRRVRGECGGEKVVFNNRILFCNSHLEAYF